MTAPIFTHPDILCTEQSGANLLHHPTALNLYDPPVLACEDCGLEIFEGDRYYTTGKTIYCAECFLETYGEYA